MKARTGEVSERNQLRRDLLGSTAKGKAKLETELGRVEPSTAELKNANKLLNSRAYYMDEQLTIIRCVRGSSTVPHPQEPVTEPHHSYSSSGIGFALSVLIGVALCVLV